MVERYVFIRLQESSAGERDRIVQEFIAALAAVPEIVDFAVGTPADEHARAAWDISIRVRLASVADLEPFRVHPAHRRAVDEVLKPHLHVIKAWNFQALSSQTLSSQTLNSQTRSGGSSAHSDSK